MENAKKSLNNICYTLNQLGAPNAFERADVESINNYIEEMEEKLISYIDSETGYQQRIKELEDQILLRDNKIILHNKAYKILADELIEKEKALYYLASWYNCDNLGIDYRYCGNMEEGENCSCSECIINHLLKEIRKGKIK